MNTDSDKAKRNIAATNFNVSDTSDWHIACVRSCHYQRQIDKTKNITLTKLPYVILFQNSCIADVKLLNVITKACVLSIEMYITTYDFFFQADFVHIVHITPRGGAYLLTPQTFHWRDYIVTQEGNNNGLARG